MDYKITPQITVDIHLDGITMEAYAQLEAFLSGLKGISTKNAEVAAPQEETHKTGVQGKISNKRLQTGENTRELYALLTDAQAHPDKYNLTWLLTKDIKPYLPAFYRAQKDLRSVGHILGVFAAHGLLQKRQIKHECQMLMQFLWPVIKKSEKPADKATDADSFSGSLLRTARMDAGMSIAELSNAIGYNGDIILKWEMGQYHMAPSQRESINRFFCRDIFADSAVTA